MKNSLLIIVFFVASLKNGIGQNAYYCLERGSFEQILFNSKTALIDGLLNYTLSGELRAYRDSGLTKEIEKHALLEYLSYSEKKLLPNPDDPDNPYISLAIDTSWTITAHQINMLYIKRYSEKSLIIGLGIHERDFAEKNYGYYLIDKDSKYVALRPLYTIGSIFLGSSSTFILDLYDGQKLFETFAKNLGSGLNLRPCTRGIYTGVDTPVRNDTLCNSPYFNALLAEGNPYRLIIRCSIAVKGESDIIIVPEFVGLQYILDKQPENIELPTVSLFQSVMDKRYSSYQNLFSQFLLQSFWNEYPINCWEH